MFVPNAGGAGIMQRGWVSQARSEVRVTHDPGILKGTIHGKTIELEREPGLPDGQAVAVIVRPEAPAGEGLRRSFGAWSDIAGELDQFLEEVRRDRLTSRHETLAQPYFARP
jgi:hypothetical protein